jgi:hypothetical protein
VLRLVATHRLDLSDSITHTHDLADVDAALTTLHPKSGDPQGVVVTVG